MQMVIGFLNNWLQVEELCDFHMVFVETLHTLSQLKIFILKIQSNNEQFACT